MISKISCITTIAILFTGCKNIENGPSRKHGNTFENSTKISTDSSESDSEKKLDAIQEKLNGIDTSIPIEMNPPSEDRSGFRDGSPIDEDSGEDEDEVALRVDEETKALADKANGFAEKIEAGAFNNK